MDAHDHGLISPAKASRYERERAFASLSHINQVVKKIENGTYPQKEYPCFCGSVDDMELSTRERNGMPHRAVMCKSCALIRINPRMTQEAYTAFYNDHYRHINYGHYVGERQLYSFKQERRLNDVIQQGKGECLHQLLMDMGADTPKSVLDWGCHQGGMLESFKDLDAEVVGIEIDESSADFSRKRGITVYRTIDEVIAKGLKFDFVIMQDIIEHLMDLKEVAKVHQVLNKGAFLYVFTPGFFVAPPRVLFQIAHTYQFCAWTLEWVMDQLGFTGQYINEDVISFWQTKEYQTDLFSKPVEWCKFQLDHARGVLDRVMPPFKATCKYTRRQRYEHMESNISKKFPDVSELKDKYSGPLAIVSGGPSVDGEIETLKNLKLQGVPIMVISRMYPWAVEHNLGPDFVLTMDSSDEQLKGFTHIQDDAIHLVASVTLPAVVDKLEGKKIYIWESMDDPKCREIRRKYEYSTVAVANGGGTVAISGMSLAFIMGFDSLHIFGLDCLVREKTYAEGITEQEPHPMPQLAITVNGHELVTTVDYLEFTKCALNIAWAGWKAGFLKEIKFYGDSLINYQWDGKFVTADEAAAAYRKMEKETLDGNKYD